MPKLIKFSYMLKDGREYVTNIRECIRPQQTTDWRDLNKKLNTQDNVKSISWHLTNLNEVKNIV